MSITDQRLQAGKEADRREDRVVLDMKGSWEPYIS